MIYSDPVLYANVAMMFSEAYFREKFTPQGGELEVKDFDELLQLLNGVMTIAPGCYYSTSSGSEQPAGLISLPISALLYWPMVTTAGYDVFSKAYVVSGSYYLENLYQSFLSNNPDTSAPDRSQGFLTAVATRALIFIEADNPAIGLMCVMPVGMAEVSSCDITVKPGEHVNKGDPLGMFHFGGSTHCLFFRPGVNLEFDLYGQTPGPQAEINIRVDTAIARCPG